MCGFNEYKVANLSDQQLKFAGQTGIQELVDCWKIRIEKTTETLKEEIFDYLILDRMNPHTPFEHEQFITNGIIHFSPIDMTRSLSWLPKFVMEWW